jgi:hypothetical protein
MVGDYCCLVLHISGGISIRRRGVENYDIEKEKKKLFWNHFSENIIHQGYAAAHNHSPN